ncbi:protein kinase domain-containing protein [Streptomyces sp. HUAS TT7]|uniref:serine/threonine protein kinase n=1 Tax=Streptomyces sp. HUAS TT7 TaxID=3447507 RepID=UPI003F65846F
MSRLGSGGFGRVWKARDEVLHVDVALKEVWLPPASSEAEQSERLVRAAREARNAALLRDHPNVVAVHDVVVEDGVPWTVMRLVEGRSLAEALERQGPLSPDDVTRIATAVLGALGAAHAAGIVHRDIKPANVMLADDGGVLLTDFGIALRRADTALTAPGSFIGSVEYIAPERARGQDGLPASDLFSLGVALYQAVEGVSPFRRDTDTGSLTAVLFDEAPPPLRAARLAPLITRLLEKDPDKRPTIPEALNLIHPPSDPRVEPHHAPLAPRAADVRDAGLRRQEDVGAARDRPASLDTADTVTRPGPSPAKAVTPSPGAGITPTVVVKQTPRIPRRVKAVGAIAVVVLALVGAVLVYRSGGDDKEKRSIPEPCGVPSGATAAQFKLVRTSGGAPGDDPAARECRWSSGSTVLVLTLRKTSPGSSPSWGPDPDAGVPDATVISERAGFTGVGSCTVQWPTPFGSAEVASLNSSGQCSDADAFVRAVAPRLR